MSLVQVPKTIGRFLLYFVNKQRLSFAFITITASIASLANNTIWPYITGSLVDAFQSLTSQDRSSDTVLDLALTALLFWIFIECVQRTKGMLLGYAMPQFEANIRLSMFSYISNHSHSYFVERHVGGIAQRISDMPRSAKLVVDDALTVFTPLLVSIFASSSVFFSMHSALAALLFLWLGAHFSLCIFFCIRAANSVSVQSAARATLQGKIVDSMSNHLNVKLFTAQQHEMHTIQQAQLDEVQKHRYSLTYIEKFKILLSVVGIVNVSLLMYTAIMLWQQNIISAGEIVFLITSILSLMTNLWFAGDEISYMFYELGVCKQALTLIQEPTEVHHSSLKALVVSEGKIEFDDVSFNYGSNTVFKDKHLVIEGGQKVGLIGFSGSGKTTFVNLLMRLYDISAGAIKIDGQDISQVSLNSLRNSITFIPQDPFLFHRSVFENIRYGNICASEDEVRNAAKRACCHDFIMSLEHGYNTIVGERGSKLSGGQRQRIAIARAILKGTPILIMDEATSALDAITEKAIETGLKHLMHDKTVIVIAHKLSTLLHLERILVFENGDVVEDGRHQELLAMRGRYARFWKIQQDGFIPENE